MPLHEPLVASEKAQHNRTLALDMSYFDRSKGLFVLCNPKCASTSIQGFFAEREGLDIREWCDQASYDEVGWEQALGLTREAGVLAGQWLNLDVASRLEASTSSEVRRVAFVREPISRAWSAWLSKICFREPRFRNLSRRPLNYATSEWIDRVSDLRGAVEEFEQFVFDLTEGIPASSDIHFAPQSSFLAGLVPDTEFHCSSTAKAFFAEVYRTTGSRHEGLPSLNSTKVPVPMDMLSRDAVGALEEFYAEDFANLADVYHQPALMSPESIQARWESLLPVLELRVRAAQRLSVVADRLTSEAARADAAREEAWTLDQSSLLLATRNEALEAELRALRCEVGELRCDRGELEDELLGLRDERMRDRSALETIYSSRSWRMTAVFRSAGLAVRRLVSACGLRKSRDKKTQRESSE